MIFKAVSITSAVAFFIMVNIMIIRRLNRIAFKKGIEVGRLQVLKENVTRAKFDIHKFEHGNNVVDALIASHDNGSNK